MMLGIREILPEGVYHWTARHPEWEGPVSAYAIDDGGRLAIPPTARLSNAPSPDPCVVSTQGEARRREYAP
jgi:hypothetical protein